MALLAVLAQIAGALPGAVAMPVVPPADDLATPGADRQVSAIEPAGVQVQTARAFGGGDAPVIVADERDAPIVIDNGGGLRPACDRTAPPLTAFRPCPTGPPHTA